MEGKVHSIVDKLLKEHPDGHIVTTGHSLGGALSEICALEMTKKYGSKVKEIYNFGAPRLGNEQFAHFMNLKIPTIFRVTYSHDLAPHLPPTNFEYLHPASEVFYTDNFNKYKVCDSSGEDPSCSNQYYPHYTFADHHVYFVPMDSSLC